MLLTVSKCIVLLVRLFPLVSIGSCVDASGEYANVSEPSSGLVSNHSDERKDIATALFRIAKVLETNNEDSRLVGRLNDLELSLSLCLEENALLEKRLQKLEEVIPSLKSELEISSEFFERTKELENTTKAMLQEFEEKLSTLAGEIVRLKSVAIRERKLSKSYKDELNMAEESREVGLQRLCAPVASSSFSANFSSSICLFTSEGRMVDWPMADRFCKLQKGTLASLSDIEMMHLMKEDSLFWVSENSAEEIGKDFKKHTEQLTEFSTGTFLANSAGKLEEKHLSLKDPSINKVTSKSSLDDSSTLVKILNLSHSGEDENIDKNVYVSNLRVEEEKSPQNFASVIGDSAEHVQVVQRDKRSLNIPPDALNIKDFLKLQSMEKGNGKNLIVPIHDLNQMLPSISQAKSLQLPSILKEDAGSYPKSSKSNDKKCPLLVCNRESSNCKVILNTCSDLNLFWCKKI